MKAPRFFGPWESPSAAAGRACRKAEKGASKSGSRTGAAVVPMEELTGERPFPARLSGTMISDFQESCKADRQTSIHVPREGDDVCRIQFCPRLPCISIHVPREGDDATGVTLIQLLDLFQSTSPARGTTRRALTTTGRSSHFNPRPPRGGRQGPSGGQAKRWYFNPRPPRGGRPK